MSSIFDSFFDKAKDVADIASKKTGELVEISKYKIESVKINNEVEKLYQKLGNSVYLMVKGGYDNQELIEGLTEDIDEMLMRLEAVNEKISDMKNVVYCGACGAKNEMENYYCVKCGSRLKKEFESEDADDNINKENCEENVNQEESCENKDNTADVE